MSWDEAAYRAAERERNLIAVQIICIVARAWDLPDRLRERLAPLLDAHRTHEAAMDRALDLPEHTS